MAPEDTRVNSLKHPVFFLSLLCLASCAHVSPGERPLPAEYFRAYQACDHDTDCVRANNGCCDCANGGELISVHRKHEKDVRDLFHCPHVMCTQMAGDCSFQVPYCKKAKGAQSGLCALKPPGRKL